MSAGLVADAVETLETCNIIAEADVVRVRLMLRRMCDAIGMGAVDSTKLITACSELARNVLRYGGGGVARANWVKNHVQDGVCVCFEDQGPGIANLEQALTDGFSTGNSLGIGLPGARRLCDEFEIQSFPGQGTTVTITKWAR